MSDSESIDPSFPSIEHHSNFDSIAKILLLGETGAGKSTFINYLCNYFHKGDLNNLKIAIPSKYHPYPTENFVHDELDISDNTQSKTNMSAQYMFTDSTTHKQYIFIDTPGLSDTRSIEQNEININKIINATTQLGNLTSIIIVVNGSISRLTINLRSVITCLNGNIPDIILENVIVVLTNVKKHESSFDLTVLNLHGKVYPFYMQNGAFVSDPQTWKKSVRKELQSDWNRSMNQIPLILQTIDRFKQISVDAFIQMKQIRNDIKLIIHRTRLEIIQIQKLQDELSQLDSAIKQADQDVLTYQNHTRLKTIEKIEFIDAPYHSTLCSSCNHVCHNNCHLNETTRIGAQIFSQCIVMENGKCKECRNHCSYINHYHAKKTIHITYETLHDILNEFKQKYDRAYENRNNYQEKFFTRTETKQILEKTLKEKIHEIKNKSIQLCQICSGFNLAQEFTDLIQQLKTQSDLLKNLQTKLQAETLIKNLTKFTQAIEDNREKHRRNRSSMQIINQEEFIEKKSTDINQLKIVDLIELYHNSIDHSFSRSITDELHRRAQGKSIGPLLTSNEILIIKNNLEKYKHRHLHELSYTYHQLQQQIDKIIKSDILNIVYVNSELLIENFIVQTLLDDKEKNPQTSQSFPQSTTNSFPQLTINSFPQPTNSPPYPISQPVSRKTSSMNAPSIGFSHLNSPPYPSLDDPSPMPALPANYSPTIPHSQTFFRLEDYRLGSIDTNSTTSVVDEQDLMPIPMPTNNQRQITNLYNSKSGFTTEHQRMTQSSERSSRPDVIPSDTDLFGSLKSLSNRLRNYTTDSLDNEDFHLVDNSRLLLMYTDTNLQKNESRKGAIHQELQRRCYGEYPILIKEKKNLFQEKFKTNEVKTLGELIIAQAAVKQKIRGYLQNDDVTLINDIPSELIIEANVLNHLILSKKQV